MALQLRHLLPRGCAHQPVPPAFSLPPSPAMLHFGAPQRYSSTSFPFSPFLPYEMCGVGFRNNSARQLSSSVGSRVALQLKSSAFLTTGLLGKRSSRCSGAAESWGIALKANNIGNLQTFSTTSSRKSRLLIKNKSSFSCPNTRRQDGSIAHIFFQRSEKRQSTLAACSTITDEASTSPGDSSMSITNTKTDTTKKKSRKGRKKEVSEDAKETDAPTKKKKKYFGIRKAAAKTTEEKDTKLENKEASTSKSKKAVDSSKTKKMNNSLKSKTKGSSGEGSGGERKPLTPLYPPTAKSVVVVESVTKAKIIQKYLGGMYEVLPSYGHLRDLARRSKSVRPDDGFSMVWEVPTAAWTHLKSIKVALKGKFNSCI